MTAGDGWVRCAAGPHPHHVDELDGMHDRLLSGRHGVELVDVSSGPTATVTAVGRLVVIEGLDGAGKRTLADALTRELRGRGTTVARFAFPRYGADVHAQLVADALHGRLGDLGDSVHGMAVLFALDRRAAADELRAAAAAADVVLVDRYVASNAAYGAARMRQGAEGEFVGWVRALELDRFAIPVPDLQLLLRVPREVAAARAVGRERADTGRVRDAFESDARLQERCAAVYEELAAASWLSPWRALDGVGRIAPEDLALGLAEE